MKKTCPQCHSLMSEGKTTLHFERKNFYSDVENVAALICPQCGTRSIPAEVAKRVSEAVEHLFRASIHKPVFSGISFHKVA